MKLRCSEEELRGLSQEEAQAYTYSVNVPMDIELYTKLYNLHPDQKGSETLDSLLKWLFSFDV